MGIGCPAERCLSRLSTGWKPVLGSHLITRTFDNIGEHIDPDFIYWIRFTNAHMEYDNYVETDPIIEKTTHDENKTIKEYYLISVPV